MSKKTPKGAKLFPQDQLQQGDVQIYSVEGIPETAKAAKIGPEGFIVRHGEVTGHCHRLVETIPQSYTVAIQGEGDAQIVYATITEDGVSLVHDEHNTIPIPKGTYAFGPTHMWDYDTEERKNVAD